ncbi:type I methionyl aminopeptidase [Pumilibacter intestinalis]|jgi:methionyl aminopeptidase|uniref:type I methionyl aminopeptidase n=1 Tax=Pumilibacter intestinalis TaxID=2941511 RepID=UPI00203CA9DD|nr:type I methionyl aminopeptidase [Pumilibacter intestinalis]
MIYVKKPNELDKMRVAGKLTGDALKHIEEKIKPGVTTAQINKWIHEFITSQNATPSFLGYHGYPASACVSVNDVVVHGIPGDRVLQEGDIVSVDVGVIKNGWQGDAARTFAVGKISPEAQKLIDVTRECFFEGIKHARNGRRLGDLSSAIQRHAESHGYGVVREMIGHGIGRQMHEDPAVPNFGKEGTGVMLKTGYTIAVEPMINAGTFKIKFEPDGWTTRTADGSLSAHYENTIAIRDGEPEILTL